MKKIFATAAVLVGAIAFSAADAFAGIEFLGWEDGGSWFSKWSVDTSGLGVSFDRVRITIDNSIDLTSDPWIVTPAASNPTTTSEFETPTVIDTFTVAGWSQSGASTTAVTATGGAVGDSPSFRLHHGDAFATSADGVKMRITLFDGGWSPNEMIAYGVMAYKLTSSTTEFKYSDLTAGSVPLPPAAWSGLAMIGALGAFVVKRRRDRAVL